MLALATSSHARDIDTDLPLLLQALPEAEAVNWDDPEVAWERYDAVFVRSVWDYHTRLDEFLAWVDRVDECSRIWNPAELLRWNSDKRYLIDLGRLGIPTIPTRFVAPGEAWDDDDSAPDIDLAGNIVVKPSVGAGTSGAAHFDGDRAGAIAHISSLHARDLVAMVQPYMSDVDEKGETALVYLGQEFSHAVGKQALLRDVGSATLHNGSPAEELSPRIPTPDERGLGINLVATLPPTAYLRVDLLPTPNGPVVLEVEATEPALFLDKHPQAAKRAADAFRRIAGG